MTEKEKIIGYEPAPSSFTRVTTQPVVRNTHVTHGPVSVKPRDYLLLSIFTIVCCFWPIGIIALIKSIETRKNNQAGRSPEAKDSSKEAKQFNMMGICIGVAVYIMVCIIVSLCLIPVWIVLGINASH